MSIQSTLGHGTTIELLLPISSVLADGEEPDGASNPAVAARGIALLVDDEELVRMSTADMLSELGYEVVEAVSAEGALELLSDGLKPTIVVTDHIMSGMSGAQLARGLKARRPGLPVLIVSGYAEADGIDKDIPRLTKPFRSADLAQILSLLSPNGAGS